MDTPTPWTPDWALPPGVILTELMEERGISPVRMCAMTGMTPGELEGIATGAERITNTRAAALAAATRVPANFWLNLQSTYDAQQPRDETTVDFERRDAVSGLAFTSAHGVEENLRWLLGASLEVRVAVVSRDRIATTELALTGLDEDPEPWRGDLAVVLEAARAWAEDHGYGP